MVENPLVTVVIPTWNRAALVGEAIASVVAQTYPHWEIVAVDDGSNDDTLERLREIPDPRLKILASPHIGRIARVRNLGVAQATGEWIAFLDSDDLWLPEKLTLQIAALRQTGAAWCYADHGLIGENGAPVAKRGDNFQPKSGRILRALLRDETAASIVTLIVRRDVFDALGGFDESLTMRDDLDFTLRLAAAADAVAVPDILTLVREHPARTTNNLANPHELSAVVYAKLVARETDADVVRMGRLRQAHLLAAAGAHRIVAGQWRRGVRLSADALAKGASGVFLARQLASVWRARRARSK